MANFQDKVVYQIYPKSFCDTNGDGLGDLPGVTRQTGLSPGPGGGLSLADPLFPSPQRDNATTWPATGPSTPGSAPWRTSRPWSARRTSGAIGLMLDMVFNHTSTSHEWFQRALAGEKKYQDYYIFKEGSPDQPPTNWVSKFGGPAWE